MKIYIKIIISYTLCLVFISCVSSSNYKDYGYKEYYIEQEATIQFNKNIKISPPRKKPESVEEHIRYGLYNFEQSNFKKAALEFEFASEKIPDNKNNLFRKCIMSSLICHLLSGDSDAFFETYKNIQLSYNDYEWIAEMETDLKLKNIVQLHDQLIKNY